MEALSVIKNKKTRLFTVLSGIFLTNALVAEIIGLKIFSAEATLNLPPANISLLDGWVLDFNLTAGVVVWPVVFITTDIINEYFGKAGVRRISFLTVYFIAYTFIVIYIITLLPPATFWQELNNTDPQGNAFDMNFAFKKIFRQSNWIIFGSMIAFLIGQFLDVFVFQKLRRITGHKMIWLRATGSTLISQLVDSFVVLFVAFYIGANWSAAQVISVGIINYIYKFLIAIALTPLLYAGHYLIDHYLGKEVASEMAEEASESSQTLF